MERDCTENTIPRVIHYCWLSKSPYPDKIKRCMDSWRRVMPEYEIRLWDTDSFDVSSVPYVKEAFDAGKWAFAADYIRMYALYKEGGIYLDSDVKVLKPFDAFLGYPFFSCMEYHPTQVARDHASCPVDKAGNRITEGYVSGIQIQAAVMGAQAGNPFLKDVLDWYEGQHFLRPDGTLATDVLAPQIYARIAENYGFRYVDGDQSLGKGLHIFPSETFAGNKHEATSGSYAIHLCAHSWHLSPLEKLKKFIGYKATRPK